MVEHIKLEPPVVLKCFRTKLIHYISNQIRNRVEIIPVIKAIFWKFGHLLSEVRENAHEQFISFEKSSYFEDF